MLNYKILIKLFVLSCVSEGCTSAACILSPSEYCGVVSVCLIVVWSASLFVLNEAACIVSQAK